MKKENDSEAQRKEMLTELVNLYSSCDNIQDNKEEVVQELEVEVMKRVIGIIELILTKNNIILSIEETLEFLNNAANSYEFQIWLGDLEERKLSKFDRIKVLLSRTSDNDIVRLFNVKQEKMQTITMESHKKLTKSFQN